MFFSPLFLEEHFILATTCMKRNTLIKHKEATIVREENGHVSLNDNVLLTTLQVKYNS